MRNKLKLWILLAVIVLAYATAFEPEEKADLDRRQQQIVAQIQSKIELESKKTKDEVKNLIGKEAQDIQNNLIKDMKKRFKEMLVGVFGFIFVVLSVFEIVKIKVATDVLYKKKIKDVEIMRKHLVKEQDKLRKYKNKLKKHHSDLKDYKRKLQQTAPKWRKVLLVSNILTFAGLLIMLILYFRG
jgi:hypothetical protein